MNRREFAQLFAAAAALSAAPTAAPPAAPAADKPLAVSDAARGLYASALVLDCNSAPPLAERLPLPQADLDLVRTSGITPEEFTRAKYQLRARYVFESDSVTNIAHQLGYFQTIANVDLYRDFVESLAIEVMGIALRIVL